MLPTNNLDGLTKLHHVIRAKGPARVNWHIHHWEMGFYYCVDSA